MLKLKDAQLVLLSAAAQRKNQIVVPPADPKAAMKLFKPLLKQGLVEEVPAVNGHPVFRRDREGAAIALRISSDGLSAIGIEIAETPLKASLAASLATEDKVQREVAAKKSSRKPASSQKKPKGKAATIASSSRHPSKGGSPTSDAKANRRAGSREGSKQALLISMLQKKQGADIDAIVRATDWLPHTARAVISGLRKAGYEVELERKEGAKSVYRIVGGPKRARKPA